MDGNVRMPGVEPGSQAWEACMMPLHYMRPRYTDFSDTPSSSYYSYYFHQYCDYCSLCSNIKATPPPITTTTAIPITIALTATITTASLHTTAATTAP